MGDDAPHLRVRQIDAFEREVPLRIPFRFGAATVRAARQAFVRARVELEGGASAEGWAAELMIPKWFDKRPELSNDENIEQLRDSIRRARAAQDAVEGTLTAHDHARARAELGAAADGLVAGFGPALLDRALLDALGRATGTGLPSLLRANLPGIDWRGAAGLPGDFDTGAFLATLFLGPSIRARHTIGLVDPLGEGEVAERLADGLPQSLEAAIDRYGHRDFKIKLSGEVGRDLDRLRAIAARLDPIPGGYRTTLDGNEQFESVDPLETLLASIREEPGLRRFEASILYVEQPLPRDRALGTSVRRLERFVPLVIDESDDSDDAFVRARAAGYAGVSSKTCKGVYRSLLNRARCAVWSEQDGPLPAFLCAEDLTTQPGLAVQQDLALASLVGAGHVERNGHHYVDGMVGAPDREMDDFARVHPRLYVRDGRGLHLRIEGGSIDLGTLGVPGFASGAWPREEALSPMEGAAG